MPVVRSTVALGVLLLACTGTVPRGEPAPLVEPAEPPTPASAEVEPVVEPAVAAVVPRERPDAKIVALYEGGAIAVGTRAAEYGAEIVATLLDARGFARGEPWVVAATRRDLHSVPMHIDTRGTATWLVWIDTEADLSDRAVTRALRLVPPGASPAPQPIVIAATDDRVGDQVRVVVLADGRAAVATTSSSKRKRCRSDGRCHATAYEIVIVGEGGEIERLHRRVLDGLMIEDFIDLGDALAIATSAWEARLVRADAVVPYGPRAPRGLDVAPATPDYRELYFIDGTLVTVTLDGDCPGGSVAREGCTEVWFDTPTAKPKRVADGEVLEDCIDGRPMLELGNARKRLRAVPKEPWTGEALLGAAGRIYAEACDGTALDK